MSVISQIVGGLSGLEGMPSGGFLGGLMPGGASSQSGGGSMISSGVKSILLSGLLSMIMNRAAGGNGLSSLLDRFRKNGLSQHADSWVSNGQNQPVSPQDVKSAMGNDLDQLAAKAGISKDEAAQHLSGMIPEVVNRLTPNGQVPDQNTLSSALGQLFGH